MGRAGCGVPVCHVLNEYLDLALVYMGTALIAASAGDSLKLSIPSLMLEYSPRYFGGAKIFRLLARSARVRQFHMTSTERRRLYI